MGELLQPTDTDPLGSLHPYVVEAALARELTIHEGSFMSYITQCVAELIKAPELQLHVSDIVQAHERLQRIIDRFHIPTDVMYLSPQYQFQIATLSLALAHLVPTTDEENVQNPHVQAIEKVLRAASEREAITEDIDHLVVAVIVIDGLPQTIRETFARERQTFIDLYRSTQPHTKERHAAIEKADAWLRMIRSQYATENVLRLTYADRNAFNTAYENICKDFHFTEEEEDSNYASGMGLTSVELAILCIEELATDELEAHEKEHLPRNVSVFGLFGVAVEEALVELESLRKLRRLHSIQDIDVDTYDVREYYVREMRMLQHVHRFNSETYDLLNQMSFTTSTEADAYQFAINCIQHFGLEGYALFYQANVVPLDDNKEKEDLTHFVGAEYGNVPTEVADTRLQQLFAHYSSNLFVM